MPYLAINIDHVATIRQARGGVEPDLALFDHAPERAVLPAAHRLPDAGEPFFADDVVVGFHSFDRNVLVQHDCLLSPPRRVCSRLLKTGVAGRDPVLRGWG